jgi:hypothetical protein
MKRKSRAVQCPIAEKTVSISLRQGGGLGEPAGVYVRCEERECQHVDLNQAPCPLRVDMFSDGSDRRIVEYLLTHAGGRFCYGCLIEQLGISHDQVRRASWIVKDSRGSAVRASRCATCRRRRVTIGFSNAAPAMVPGEISPRISADPNVADALGSVAAYLRARPGCSLCVHCLARDLAMPVSPTREAVWRLEAINTFDVRTAQCVSCLMSKRVIRHERPVSEEDIPRRIIEFLMRSPGERFCPSCIAFASDSTLADVRRILANLEAVAEFLQREGACSVCGRRQSVIGVSEKDAEGSPTPGELAAEWIDYRRFRIRLLSYRTAMGWRPFALVKSESGARIPDAPVFISGLMPTKVDADDAVAALGRHWIDQRAS